MSHGAKMTVFFAMSVALHGAGLWAVAGRIEPHAAEPAPEVAIVDRDLFFRHAERAELQASRAVSPIDRLDPSAAAPASQPERREATPRPGNAVAAVDLSTLAATPSPRSDAASPENIEPERSEPVRMSGVPAPPTTTVRPRAQRAAGAAQAVRARTNDLTSPSPSRPATPTIAPPAPRERMPETMAATSPPAAERVTALLARSTAFATAARAPASDMVASARPSEAEPVISSARQPGEPAEQAARAPASDTVASARPGEAEPVILAARLAGEAAEQAVRAPASDMVASARASDAEPVIAPPMSPTQDAARAPAGPNASRRASHEPPRRPAGAIVQLARASFAEAVATAAAAAAERSAVEMVENRQPALSPVRQPEPAPAPEVARGEARSAQRTAGADSARLESSTMPASAAPAAPIPRAPDLPVALAADVAPPRSAVPERPAAPGLSAARERQALLRGTLPPPLIDPLELAPLEAESAQPAGVPGLARRQGESLRVGAAPTTGTAAVPRQPAPPAEQVEARAPRPAPARSLSRPTAKPTGAPAAPAVQAAPRDLAALAPAVPAWRAQADERAASRRSDRADRFTRRYNGGECFFPLRVAAQGDAAIRGYGLQAESVQMFRQAFAQALGSTPEVDWRPLTDAQCSGISFTRLILGGSAPSVEIGLARKTLDVGEDLAGRVTGSRFDFVTLLVVDDSGVVHNVLEYLRPDTGELEFSVPVHPVDEGKDRVQLIMAVGASSALDALESTTPMHSDDFFPELLSQARAAGATLELGLEDFVIRDDGP